MSPPKSYQTRAAVCRAGFNKETSVCLGMPHKLVCVEPAVVMKISSREVICDIFRAITHVTNMSLLWLVSVSFLSRMTISEAISQCEEDLSIGSIALKGHTFKTLAARAGPTDCFLHCEEEVRCQSYNYVINNKMCELNDRTKEAAPEDFVPDRNRFYKKRSTNRVPLGSIPKLLAKSCKEIKDNEGGEVVSGNYWLDSMGTGEAILVHCNMETEFANFCIKHQCKNYATCTNSHVNYTCSCATGWTGKYCESGASLSCRQIKNNTSGFQSGVHWLDPNGGNHSDAFDAYCDMTSFGGGWTMCYTTDNLVKMRTEINSLGINFGENGYRSDCNNIPFTEIMFVDEANDQRTYFSKSSGGALVASGNYRKQANAFGLWNGSGVANTGYQYQLNICDQSFYSGFMISGFTNNCYKHCHSWCGDLSSDYYRTASTHSGYAGVAFKENGAYPLSKKLISVGLR